MDQLRTEIRAALSEMMKGAQADGNPGADRWRALLPAGGRQAEQRSGPIVRDDSAGLKVARMARAIAWAKGDEEKAIRLIADRYGDKELAKAMEVGKAQGSMEAGTPTAGGFTVPEQYAAEIIPLLYDNVVVNQLGARVVTLETDTLHLPRIDTGTAAAYMGETKAVSKTKQKLGRLTLRQKKLGALVPISNDLLLSADPSADAYVRDDLIMAIALQRDYSALFGAGTEYTPRGLVYSDIQKISIGALLTADSPATFKATLMQKKKKVVKPGWVFNSSIWLQLYNMKTTTGAYLYRDEMSRGLLLGAPYQITDQVPVGTDAHALTTMIYGDWSEFIIAQKTAVALAVSTEASFTDEDGNIVGAFENDLTLIRAIERHDFGARIPNAFVHANDIYTIA